MRSSIPCALRDQINNLLFMFCFVIIPQTLIFMGYSSGVSLDHCSTNLMTNTSFTDLLNSSSSSGTPKFKSVPPPSLPLSPPSSSYFSIPPGLSPAELLDSPVLLSSSYLLPSPTTGSFAAQSFNWNPNSINNHDAPIKSSDFTFRTHTRPNHVWTTTATATTFQPSFSTDHNDQQPSWSLQDHNDPSSMKAILKSEFPASQSYTLDNITKQELDQNPSFQPALYIREQTKSVDGYNWRKYGQKQVKGSENPRSYYKCTYPNCPMKKKIEKSLDGQITEIVYKGSHNHPKPVNARRSSASAIFHQTSNDHYLAPQRSSSGQIDSATTPVTSSISLVDDENDMSSQRSRSVGDEFDVDQPEAKRWKGEVENECMSAAPGSRTVREPRVVVQTTSDIDILDDGYRWRKYGQKVVKGNPNPRSYYKCTHPGCPVRKHVERAANDLRAVITTYEGKHNHDVPAARGSGMNRQIPSNGTALIMGATRPSAVNYVSSGSANPHALQSRLPASSVNDSTGQLSPFSVELLQNPGNFGFSGFRNQTQYTDNMFSNKRAKEEPKDTMFFESMLG